MAFGGRHHIWRSEQLQESIIVYQGSGTTGLGDETFENPINYRCRVEKVDSFTKNIGIDIIGAEFIVYLDYSYNNESEKWESPVKILESTRVRYQGNDYRVVANDETNNFSGAPANQRIALKRSQDPVGSGK